MKIATLFLCGTALASVNAASARAQAAAPAPPPVTAPMSPSVASGVEEIVVTARRTTENLRDVPVSVTAVSGSQLAADNITQIGSLTDEVPSLVVAYAATQPVAEIRGFGTGNSISFDQAVGKFIDNVSYGQDQDARLPLFDLGQVEVLKGPQVLLYGNSSIAGALNITSKKPGSRFEADGSVSYEGYDEESVAQGGVTLPLNDMASLRLAAFYQNLAKGDNFNEGTGKHFPIDRNYAGRATLRLIPAAGLEVLLKGEYDHLRDYGNTGEPIAQPTSGPLKFTEANLNGVVDSNNNVAPFFQSNFVSMDNQTYQADMSYSALNGVFISTSAYRKLTVGLSEDGAEPVPLFNGYIGYTYKQLSQELRYNGKLGKLDITGGFFYQNEDKDTVEVADFNFAAASIPLPLLASNLIEAENTNSYSGYGDLNYHFTPKISLEIGARYTDITRIANQANLPGNIVTAKGFDQGSGVTDLDSALNPLATAIFGVPPHQFYGLHLHEDHLQPQIVGQYKLTDKDQVYAKYVHGAQAGGFDIAYQGVPGDVSPPGAHFAPETASSVEVGVKGLAFDDKVDFAFDAFRTNFTDLQTSAYVGAATVAVVTNVGRARTQGFEGEVRYAPINHLRLAASGTFLDAAYLSFPGGQCNRAQAVAQPVDCVQNLSDTPTPFASKWAGTFSVDYDHPVAEYIVRGGVLVTARSRYNVSFNNEPLEEQAGYAQLDAHLDLRPQNGFWELSIFGRNLNDYRYNEYGSVAPGTTGGLIGFLSRGRQLGIRVSFHE